MECPQCRLETPDDSKFCKECGFPVEEAVCHASSPPEIACERKQVTVLFSDLSGYTAMTERLDPEEVKAIMSDIFADITRIITKYEGHIERFIGDAVMAVFGMPVAHELDPVRALRATLEIHELVARLSPQYEGTIGRPLSMHSGLNTGLVVTGEVDLEKGTHGITGDSVNTAARIQGLATGGEILVGQETFRRTEGYFNFEAQPPCVVKNKSVPLQTYKLVSRKEVPDKVHRISGRRSRLIGREAELGILTEALARLEDGQGSVVSICGDAGTGKSRLVSEFKATLDRKAIQWREGHAYGYTQNIPYYPLINLLSHAFQIDEGDPTSRVREKVEAGIAYVMGADTDIVPYIGSLFSIDYPEIVHVSPEFWKSHLHAAVQSLVLNIAQTGPTVICMEDLHWSDPSFVELLHILMLKASAKVLFLLAYRPVFSLFAGQIPDELTDEYHDIQLKELSTSDVHHMLGSLLKTDRIPTALGDFVGRKGEGNPFYLEELVNALMDADYLIEDDGNWRINRDLKTTEIPTSIQGMLTARIDRLDKNSKRILQEASVIGRSFLYKILKLVTDLTVPIDQILGDLEQRDLIRKSSSDRELEYIFKHVLTQEVAYNGLLKADCCRIHERIALIMERLFCDRLHDVSETLAYHYKNAKKHKKAIFYLNRSAEKSLSRFAITESHHFYEESFNLLIKDNPTKPGDNHLMLDTLLGWALVFYYRGHFRQAEELFIRYKDIVETNGSKEKLGMYYAWLGYIYSNREKLEESYQYLMKALEIGEETENQPIVGYACTWLTWTCAELGRLEDALSYGAKAQKVAQGIESDAYLYFKSLSGMGYTYYHKGHCEKAIEAGKKLTAHGEETGNVRCEAMGYYIKGYGYAAGGHFANAIENCQKAITIAKDPFYSQVPKVILGISYFLDNQIQPAEMEFQELIEFSRANGCEIAGTPAEAMSAVISMVNGNMDAGMKKLKEIQNNSMRIGRKSVYVAIEHMLGRIYLQMISGPMPAFPIFIKNFCFIARHLPFARKRAEAHLTHAIRLANEIGSFGVLGQSHLDIGRLYVRTRKIIQARESLNKAIDLFKQCQADGFLKEAEVALASIT